MPDNPSMYSRESTSENIMAGVFGAGILKMGLVFLHSALGSKPIDFSTVPSNLLTFFLIFYIIQVIKNNKNVASAKIDGVRKSYMALWLIPIVIIDSFVSGMIWGREISDAVIMSIFGSAVLAIDCFKYDSLGIKSLYKFLVLRE